MLTLSDINEDKGNFERSIYLLGLLKQDIGKTDSRYKILEEKISELKRRQLKYSKDKL